MPGLVKEENGTRERIKTVTRGIRATGTGARRNSARA